MSGLLAFEHPRAAELVRAGVPVVVGINPVEYHGPHLSVHNDELLARGLAELLLTALQERGHDWPWLWAGELGIGVDPVKGPGSIIVPYAKVRRRLEALCAELLALGVRRVVLTTFHGSPLHNLAIDRAARLLEAHGVRVFTPMNQLLRELMHVDAVRVSAAVETVAPGADRALLVPRLPFDVHAGFLETSLSLLLAPETVQRHREVVPCPIVAAAPGPVRGARWARRLGMSNLADELDFIARGLGWYGQRPFPGYSGTPHLASAGAGQALVDQLMPRMVELAEACLLGRRANPEPVLPWIGPVTLWGRIPRSSAEVVEGSGTG